MTLIVETTDDANAKMLAAMLKNLNFVKEVTFKPTNNNKKNSTPMKYKPLTDKDWIKPGRPATDEEIDKMLDECEKGVAISAEESKENNLKRFKEWQKKSIKVIYKPKADLQIFQIMLYIAENGFPDTALKFAEKLYKFGYSLAHFPNKFPVCRHEKFAKRHLHCAVYEHDYVFVYKTVHSRLVIYNVIHSSLIH